VCLFITPGSSALFSINFDGPYLPISYNVPVGSDPEIGTKASIVPTYSTTPSIIQHNIFTMSVVSTDTLTFSATTSIVYKNKNYFGPVFIPGGFTASDLASVASVASYVSDNVIKGLTYSDLATTHSLEQKIIFPSGYYFVYAAPTVFGN